MKARSAAPESANDPETCTGGGRLLAPGLLWTALFCLLPILVVLAVSFATRGTYGGVLWEFSLENYRDLLHPQIGRAHV